MEEITVNFGNHGAPVARANPGRCFTGGFSGSANQAEDAWAPPILPCRSVSDRGPPS